MASALKSLLNFIPVSDYRHRSARRKYHRYHIGGWRSTTVRFIRNFLPHAVWLCDDILSAVFPTNFDKGISKNKAYSYLKGQQPTKSPLRLRVFLSGCDHLLSNGP
ncbi:hypothetical protein EVAR_14257_1 [Eumeta japonica]|uniref:Uncharacterized protein n=1 Tax=Eumeta variegata TaxID=151549 RepID=A0A4C1W8L8_EUMVA|nr:hypothetical protein EVAR_14257_1 [Eumeta japonica]